MREEESFELTRSQPDPSVDRSDEDYPFIMAAAGPYTDSDGPEDAPLVDNTAASSDSSQLAPKWLRQGSQTGRGGAVRGGGWTVSAVASSALGLVSACYRRTRTWTARPRYTVRSILATLTVAYLAVCAVLRKPAFASQLPPIKDGKYAVGTVDLEIPLETPVTTSNSTLKSTGEPAFRVETVLFSLYYPANKDAKSQLDRHRWIPRPVWLTAGGYAKLAHLDNFVTRPMLTFFLWAVGGPVEIPAEVDVPLAGSSGSSDGATDDDAAKGFPIMLFSHGSASSRTDYTHYLSSLAASGMVVAAIEHRDGSSPGCYVRSAPTPDDKQPAPRIVTILRESDLESDPVMPTDQFKAEQLAFRNEEMYQTLSVLHALQADPAPVRSSNLHPLFEGEGLATFKDRLDLSSLFIGGHSYGATLALQSLSPSSTVHLAPEHRPKAGIILDPGKSSGRLNAELTAPIMVIHSNSWSRTVSPFYGRPHFSTVKDLVVQNLEEFNTSWFLTSIGTSHPSISDAPLIEPLLLSWTTGARMDTRGAVREYVSTSLEFICYISHGDLQDDGLLKEEVTHEEYGKWVSEERKKEFGKRATWWEVHVSTFGRDDRN